MNRGSKCTAVGILIGVFVCIVYDWLMSPNLRAALSVFLRAALSALLHVSEFASCVECVPSSCVECVPSSCVECVVSCLRIRFVYLTAGSRYACNASCATVD